MVSQRLSRSLIVLRGVLYSAGFVGLWAWLAVMVRPLDSRIPFPIPSWLRLAGFVLVPGGALLAAACIGTFLTRGQGTPAPFEPPRIFVASGPYRYVRNPMYLGAAAVILGAGLLLSSPSIVLLAAGFLAITHLFVVLYEEPTLASRFGDSYSQYKSRVHRWLVQNSK